VADRRITPWTIVPGYGFAAPPSGGANGARELMRDGAVRIVERLRIGHVRVWDGKCRECAYAYPCPTITAIESVEPWATLARDGAAAAMGLTSNAPEPPPPDAPPDLLTPDEHKAG
jgi:hypothetical protein